MHSKYAPRIYVKMSLIINIGRVSWVIQGIQNICSGKCKYMLDQYKLVPVYIVQRQLKTSHIRVKQIYQ